MKIPRLNIIGKNIKRIRMTKIPPITQEQLSIKLQLQDWEIDRFGISKIERGERKVTDIEILKISKILEVDFNQLFDDK